MKNSEELQLSEIPNYLKTITRLLAISAVAGKKQREQIALLASAGLSRQEIAEILGTTPGTVSVELSILKKARHSRRE